MCSLVEYAFPELGVQVPELTQLKQETIEGFVKRDFEVYEPLRELPFATGAGTGAMSRCKLTRVDDEEVVLKVFPVVGGLRHMKRELGILARIRHGGQGDSQGLG